jgi:hypothetical protein
MLARAVEVSWPKHYNRRTRTRVSGGAGAGRAILAATRLGWLLAALTKNMASASIPQLYESGFSIFL